MTSVPGVWHHGHRSLEQNLVDFVQLELSSNLVMNYQAWAIIKLVEQEIFQKKPDNLRCGETPVKGVESIP